MDKLSTSFIALSDPTRRQMLERLARGAASVNELAAPFELSQQAVSKHLAYLEKAGLIEKHQEGRRRVCTLKPQMLGEVVSWAQRCQAFWEESLDNLEMLVKETQARQMKHGRKRQ